MNRKLITLLVTLLLVCNCNILPVQACNSTATTIIEPLDNGYYYETTITDEMPTDTLVSRGSNNYTTKTKTTQLKNSSGAVLWSVSITATFYYNGTIAQCTSCTPSAKAYTSTWSIKSVTSSKNGNSATATAITTQTGAAGTTQNIPKSVTITCNPKGIVS